jgi:small subunit ribosomal protein S6
MAVFSPDVNEDELPGAIERVGSYIEQAGGTIISTNHESPWGRRRLAYPIRYQGRDVRDGYYVLYYFDIQSTQISEIDREIRLNDQLIRHILTIRGELPPAPETETTEGEAAEAEPQATAEAGATPEAQPEPTAAATSEANQTGDEAPSAPETVETPAPADDAPESES